MFGGAYMGMMGMPTGGMGVPMGMPMPFGMGVPGVMPGVPGMGWYNSLPGRFGRDILGRGRSRHIANGYSCYGMLSPGYP